MPPFDPFLASDPRETLWFVLIVFCGPAALALLALAVEHLAHLRRREISARIYAATFGVPLRTARRRVTR